jgi:hypothetical protein
LIGPRSFEQPDNRDFLQPMVPKNDSTLIMNAMLLYRISDII